MGLDVEILWAGFYNIAPIDCIVCVQDRSIGEAERNQELTTRSEPLRTPRVMFLFLFQ